MCCLARLTLVGAKPRTANKAGTTWLEAARRAAQKEKEPDLAQGDIPHSSRHLLIRKNCWERDQLEIAIPPRIPPPPNPVFRIVGSEHSDALSTLRFSSRRSLSPPLTSTLRHFRLVHRRDSREIASRWTRRNRNRPLSRPSAPPPRGCSRCVRSHSFLAYHSCNKPGN